MANTLIFPTLTEAAQRISREELGLLRALTVRGSDMPVAQGQTVQVPIAPTMTVSNYTPAMAPPVVNRTVTAVSLTLSQAKEVTWHVTGEQIRGLNTGNANAADDLRKAAEQAIRALLNGAEIYMADKLRKGASRAVGTAGTTPFSSNLDAMASVGQVLNENGAPADGRSLVVDAAAYANLQARFANVQSTQDRRSFEDGLIPPIAGITPRLSASGAIDRVTAGSGTGITVNGAHQKGATSIAVNGTISGINPGDIIAIGGVSYVVHAVGTNTLTIGAPGLVKNAANGAPVTVNTTDFVPNLCLTRDAALAVFRPIDLPPNPTMEVSTEVDPVSGIPVQFVAQAGDGLVRYSVRAIYDLVVVSPQHLALLLG